MYNQHDTYSQTSAIIADMRLIQQFSKASLKTSQSVSQVNNLTSLINLLKSKNSQYNYSSQHRQQYQHTSMTKRAQIQNLINRIKEMKQQHDKNTEQKINKEHNYFYICPKYLQKQSLFINKVLEYSCFGVLQHTLSQSKYKSYLINQVLNKKFNVHKIGRNYQNKFNDIPIQVISFKQNKRKIDSYLKAISNLFLTTSKLSDKQWTTMFKSTTKQKIWQIMDNLLLQQPHKINQNISLLSQVAIKSLKIVQSEFNLALPSNYESILYYITTHYLRNMPGQYTTQGSIGPVWAIAYILYKSGRKQQFYRYLPDQQLRKMFEDVDRSIEDGKPLKVQGIEQNGDVFHDQLVFCLAGQSKYSSNMLCDQNRLDIAWIFLRNVGIFTENENKFIQLRQEIYNSYKGRILDQIKIKNLIYLLCFQEIVQIGINQLMDNLDYLHYLITLYHSNFFQSIYMSKSTILQKNLTQQLIQFIEKLLLQKKKQSIYYISLLPHNILANQVSSIIVKNKLIQSFKWKQLQLYLTKNLYRQVIQLTCFKYVEYYKEYCVGAEKIIGLLGQYEKGIKLIVEMNIKYILQYRRDEQMLRRGQKLIKQILKTNETLGIEYGPLFEFFRQYEKLTELILQRNQQKIYKFIKICKHILISSQIRIDTQDVINKLCQRNGFDCYLYYIKDVVRAYDISLTKMGRIHDLHELQRLTLTAVVSILDFDRYRQYSKSQAALTLIKMLEDSLYKLQ